MTVTTLEFSISLFMYIAALVYATYHAYQYGQSRFGHSVKLCDEI